MALINLLQPMLYYISVSNYFNILLKFLIVTQDVYKNWILNKDNKNEQSGMNHQNDRNIKLN